MMKISVTDEQFVQINDLCRQRMALLDKVYADAERGNQRLAMRVLDQDRKKLCELMQALFGETGQ